MKTPKFILLILFLIVSSLVGQDIVFYNGLKWLELLQDFVFVILGIFGGMLLEDMKGKNKKPPLIDSNKLEKEINDDEKKQLQEKIKTLESALDKLIK